MPRDRDAERKAEKLEEKRRAEREYQREKERDRQREEERRERDRSDALEREREEALRQQRAEQARARSKDRHKAEHSARVAQEDRRRERASDAQAQGRAASLEAARQSRLREERSATRRDEAKATQKDVDERSAAAARRLVEQKGKKREADQSELARQQRLRDSQEGQQAKQQSRRNDEARESAADGERRAAQREVAAEERRSDERTDSRSAERRALNRAQKRAQQRAAARARDQNEQRRQDASAQHTREQRSSESTSDQSARVPSGHLSNRLPWLRVAGNRIVSVETDKPVILRGINRSGLEYAAPSAGQRFIDAAGITESEIDRIVSDWGANIIRLPFNQDVALNGLGGWSAAEYLDDLDQIIYWASSRGAYTLLDLQWLDATTPFGPGNRVPPLPNLDSLLVWQFLATRYEREPAVLYDIFNEPHDPLPGDVTTLQSINELGLTSTLKSRSVTMAVWQPWARQLVRAIRRAHVNSLIFVSGVDWGYDLRGMPLTVVPGAPEVFANLVYSTHVYPGKGPSAPADGPGAPSFGVDWHQAFGKLAGMVPVFAGEWGVNETTYDTDTDIGWAERLTSYMSSLKMGWTAWSWADNPRIVRNAKAAQFEPTRFGRVVQRALAVP